MRIRILFVFAVAAILMAATGCTTASGHFDKTFTVSAGSQVIINCPVGSTIVRSGAPGTVSVDADFQIRSLGPGRLVSSWEENPPVAQSGNSVTIGTRAVEHSSPLRRITLHYRIVVPADAQVRSNIGVGDVHFEGLESRLRSNSGVGKVYLTDFNGDADINSGVGGVTAEHFSGKLKVNLGTGSLTVHATADRDGSIEMNTGTGNVEITGLRGGLRVHTGAGNTSVSGSPVQPWTIETGAGNVTLNPAQNAAFNLQANSGTGNVTVQRTLEGTVRKGHVDGRINGGGPQVQVKAGAGNVTVN